MYKLFLYILVVWCLSLPAYGAARNFTDKDISKAVDKMISSDVPFKKKFMILEFIKKENVKLPDESVSKLFNALPKYGLSPFGRELVRLIFKIRNKSSSGSISNLKSRVLLIFNSSINDMVYISPVDAKNIILYLRMMKLSLKLKENELYDISKKLLNLMGKDQKWELLKFFFTPLNHEKQALLIQAMEKYDPNIKNKFSPGPYVSLFLDLAAQNKLAYSSILLRYLKDIDINNIDDSNTICEVLNSFLSYGYRNEVYEIPPDKFPLIIHLTESKRRDIAQLAKKLLQQRLHIEITDWNKWWEEHHCNFDYANFLTSIIFNKSMPLKFRKEALRHYFYLLSKNKINKSSLDTKRCLEFIKSQQNNGLLRMAMADALMEYITVKQKIQLIRMFYREQKMQIAAMYLAYINDIYDPQLKNDIVKDLMDLKDRPKTFPRYAIMALSKLCITKKEFAETLLALLAATKNTKVAASIQKKLTELTLEDYGNNVNAWKKAIDAMPDD